MEGTNPSEADTTSELKYLREQNKLLLSQLETLKKLSTQNAFRRNNGSMQRDPTQCKPLERTSKFELNEVEFVRSRSEGDERDDDKALERKSSSLPTTLHHRHVLKKEEVGDDDHVKTSERPENVSSLVGRHHTLQNDDCSSSDESHSNKGHHHQNPLSQRKENDRRESEIRHDGKNNCHSAVGNVALRIPNGSGEKHVAKKAKSTTKRAPDGHGNFTSLSMDGTFDDDEEHQAEFPDIHITDDVDLEDADLSDGLIDDDSHNKHQLRRSTNPNSPTNSSHFPSFRDQIKDRAGWLIGLLFLQSCSSFIIQYNENFLQKHMVIVQFLTMLVGAGGNAGNQASVRVIRGLAVGSLNQRTLRPFLAQEAKMALGLSVLLGFTGFIRAALFRTPPGETIAVTASLCAIVAISVGIGSTLPLGMKRVGIDPAHSSTTIQVLMDIMGVLITVCVSSIVLNFPAFRKDGEGALDLEVGDEDAIGSDT